MKKNMTAQARLRRLQDTLIVVGQGVMAFGVWALAKTIGLCALVDEQAIRQMFAIPDRIPSNAIYICIGLVAIGDLALRILIGRAAVREGNGEQKGSLYLVIAFCFVVSHALSIAITALGRNSLLSPMDLVAATTVDVSSFVTLSLMIFCALALRRRCRAGV